MVSKDDDYGPWVMQSAATVRQGGSTAAVQGPLFRDDGLQFFPQRCQVTSRCVIGLDGHVNRDPVAPCLELIRRRELGGGPWPAWRKVVRMSGMREPPAGR